ncbi:MAG: hypothetical protein ACE5LB_00260 [Acidiferrobacterales bacterium]
MTSGLLGPAPGNARPDSPIPALEEFLARSDRSKGAAASELESLVFELFAIEVGADHDLPVAAVTRVLDLGIVDKGWWLRADPVHLQADQARLILADGAMLDVTQEEADRLVAEMMDVYADEGWVLKAARPDRWYLKPPHIPNIQTTPLPTVVGRDVHDYLPQGKDSRAWHTILNEIQILLHTAGVNTEREQRGQLPINSVWFWGGGQLPDLKQVRWSKVWSGEPLSLALARLSDTASADVPTNAEAWLESTDTPGEYLLVLDNIRTAVQYGDVDAWQGFVQTFETDWIAPLVGALKQGIVASITVYTESAPGFRLTPKALRRWWRRRKPLSKYRARA